MGFFGKVKGFIQEQEEKAEARRMRNEFQAKLDRKSRAEDAKKAKLELKELRADDKNKKAINELKEYKQKQRGTSFNMVGFDDFTGNKTEKQKSQKKKKDMFDMEFEF